jgi:hypothetical protein
MATRTVTWGDALLAEATKAPGGLKQAVETIREEVGPLIGTRNTFAKLLKAEGPESLNESDLWRAWLLLVVLGQEPADWDVDLSVMPRAYSERALRANLFNAVRRQGLEPRTRWLMASAA